MRVRYPVATVSMSKDGSLEFLYRGVYGDQVDGAGNVSRTADILAVISSNNK